MTDDRDLDDPALVAAWRAQSAETPPPALDAAILAAAHRAVKSAPEKISPGAEATRPWRWWAPLAAAATIGVIAIGALQLMPQEHDANTAVVSDMPAGAPASPVDAIKAKKAEDARNNTSAPSAPAIVQSAPTAQPPVEQRARQQAPATRPAASAEQSSAAAPQPFPARKDAPVAAAAAEQSRAAAPQPSPADKERAVAAKPSADRAEAGAAASAPAPAPVPEPFASGKVAAAQAPAQEQAAPQAQATPPAALAAAPAMSKRALRDDAPTSAPRTPDEWIARIRKLMGDGDLAEANRALTGFRAAYRDADARLPADLRPWAATVPR